MRSFFVKSAFVAVVLFASISVGAAQEMVSAKTLQTIYDSVFEIVVMKPTNDSLSYAKPLPLDRAPYSVRTDNYFSIGTAFAIERGRFLSAAHVFDFGSDSQYDAYYLRDKNGGIYEIETVYAYSYSKDFIIFDAKGARAKQTLPKNYAPTLNEPTFAVGNALGEGIVIRSGLLTSSTPEEMDGAWNWLRFSAPASPGNSGGPLVDKAGNAIGVVVAKSQNENLNYALPLSEITNASRTNADYRLKARYSLLNLTESHYSEFAASAVLPSNWKTLKKTLLEELRKEYAKSINAIFEENADAIFPNGKGAEDILNAIHRSRAISLLGQNENKRWDGYTPKGEAQTLESGAKFAGENVSGLVFFEYAKPEDNSLRLYIDSPKKIMDEYLEGNAHYRYVTQTESSRISSFGEPKSVSPYVDRYGRVWLAAEWHIEYDDSMALLFALPTPSGFVGLAARGRYGFVKDQALPDIKALADFMTVSYYGSFKEWKEFLSYTDYLPETFKDVSFSYTPRASCTLTTKRFSVSYASKTFSVSDKSDIYITPTFFRDNATKEVVWEIAEALFGESKNSSTYYSVERITNPPDSADEDITDRWETITKRKKPYDATARVESSGTYISSPLPQYRANAQKLPFVYVADYYDEDSGPKTAAKKKLTELMNGVAILE